MLGPERAWLSPALLAQCRHVVRIPTRFALNLAVAGALVLYDRLQQHGRFADRPVMPGGAAAPPPPPPAMATRYSATARRGGPGKGGSGPARTRHDGGALVRRPRRPYLWRHARNPDSAGGLRCCSAPPPSPRKPKPSAAKPEGPKAIGRFEDWTAATNSEAGQTVCYAFVRATNSAPALPGRGDVVLTVTERPSGRDAVAISAGFPYPPAPP